MNKKIKIHRNDLNMALFWVLSIKNNNVVNFIKMTKTTVTFVASKETRNLLKRRGIDYVTIKS